MKNVGQKIRERRQELGLSGTEVAERMGVAVSTIYRYESNGIKNMGIDKLALLAEILKVSPVEIMSWMTSDDESDLYLTQINSIARGLNREGKRKVAVYCDDLACSQKYDVSVDPDEELVFEDGSAVLPFELPDEVEVEPAGQAAAGDGFVYGDDLGLRYKIVSTDVPPHDFSICVKGHSMEPTIKDGAICFLKKDYDYRDGGIYLIDRDGETFIKRVYFADDRLTLVSDNKEFDDIIIKAEDVVDQNLIRGRVVGYLMPLNGKQD